MTNRRDYRLKRVVSAETDGYITDRRGKQRTAVRLLLECGHIARRQERRVLYEGAKARCYECGAAFGRFARLLLAGGDE